MNRVCSLLALLLFVFAWSAPAAAVNYYDGVRAPKGLYLLNYASVYKADVFTDGAGDPLIRNFGMTRVQDLARLSYYWGDACLHLMAPVIWQEVSFKKDDDAGLGDVNLGFGYFIPVKVVDLLPILFVKFPTGGFDKSKKVNVGGGQTDLKPTLFLHKTMGPWTVDLAAKYFYRMENPDTKQAPHNELYAEGLFGREFWSFMKVGLSLNWLQTDGQKYLDEELITGAKARKVFAVGSDVYFRTKPVSVAFTYLYDAYAENSPQGHFFQIKTVFKLF